MWKSQPLRQPRINHNFMKATINVVCYKWKVLANGECPLMLRISKDQKRTMRSLGISVNPKHWDFVKNEPKSSCPNKEYIQKIILDKKAEFQKKMIEFNSEQKEYTSTTLADAPRNKFELKTVVAFYKELIDEFTFNNKYGNRLIYKTSLNSLLSFTKGKLDIHFSAIDVEWLKKYEKWLRARKNKETTISLQFRTLRSVYNKAIENKCARKSDYPFNEYKINKFNTRTPKRAIAKVDVLKFTQDVTELGKLQYLQLSKDIFIFSYLCGGINFTDIANLTEENIVDGRLHYVRQKTHKKMMIGIPDEAMNIIQKYAPESKGYLFPILDVKVHITPLQKRNRIHKILAKVNRNLKLLSAHLGVEVDVTTYVARHTFATVLKKSGVNIAIISEALGHSDLMTTQIYLDSFDNEQLDEAMKNLL